MSILLALQGFSALAGFAGQMSAGRAQRSAMELQAYNIETEKLRSEASAIQRHNDRLEQFRSNTKANVAAFAATGRDIESNTVRAFMERQKEIATQDTQRSDLMGIFESMKLQQQATTARLEGRAAQQSATINAYTGLISSGLSIMENMPTGGSSGKAVPRPVARPTL